MAKFIFYFTSSLKSEKTALANAELNRLAEAKELLQDGSFAVSEDDNGAFMQVEGGPILLRAIANVIDATVQEKTDLETMLAGI